MNTSVHYTSNFPSNDFVNRLSDRDLLGELIGVEESRLQYQGSLQPFFSEGPDASHTKCAVARELVKRLLCEEMKAREVFADPQAVANFLKAHFYGREYESFVVLYLDAQHRLIEVEEAFRGTLTQTTVDYLRNKKNSKQNKYLCQFTCPIRPLLSVKTRHSCSRRVGGVNAAGHLIRTT